MNLSLLNLKDQENNFINTFPSYPTAYQNIKILELNNYDEILLIGSGKGVASVKKIKDINWKRKSLKKFNVFSKYYHSAIKKCKNYNFD